MKYPRVFRIQGAVEIPKESDPSALLRKWPPDRERENINRKQAVGDFKPNSLLFDMWWKKSLTGVSYVRNEGVSFMRILQPYQIV